MTDRYDGFIIVLEQNIRKDDAESILTALRQIKGVLSVTPNVSDAHSHICESRARIDVAKKIINLGREVMKGHM